MEKEDMEGFVREQLTVIGDALVAILGGIKGQQNRPFACDVATALCADSLFIESVSSAVIEKREAQIAKICGDVVDDVLCERSFVEQEALERAVRACVRKEIVDRELMDGDDVADLITETLDERVKELKKQLADAIREA